jgi:hypothetical protein
VINSNEMLNINEGPKTGDSPENGCETCFADDSEIRRSKELSLLDYLPAQGKYDS